MYQIFYSSLHLSYLTLQIKFLLWDQKTHNFVPTSNSVSLDCFPLLSALLSSLTINLPGFIWFFWGRLTTFSIWNLPFVFWLKMNLTHSPSQGAASDIRSQPKDKYSHHVRCQKSHTVIYFNVSYYIWFKWPVWSKLVRLIWMHNYGVWQNIQVFYFFLFSFILCEQFWNVVFLCCSRAF